MASHQDRLDLIALHKRCLTTELYRMGATASTRRKFFIIYDYEVGPSKIEGLFYKPIRVFIKCLLRNELNKIADIKNPVKRKKDPLI